MVIDASPRTRRRIRFINPNSALTTLTMPELIQKMTFSRKAIFAPSGLGICAAVMPKHWDAEIVDECTLDAPHRASADCDIVGITAMTTQANRAYQIAAEYRRLGVTVIMGGIHPSAMPDDALKHCDAVCIGDGESTLPHLIADWEADHEPGSGRPGGNGARRMKQKYDWTHYETAPIATPRKDLLNPRDYLIFNPIQTTRGCPHACTFCTTPGVFGRKFRLRNVADIVEEMREAKERFGTWCFIFADDDFAGNHKWAMELCAAMAPLKISWASQCDILISRNDQLLAAMRRSGCQGLILGLESRKQDTLSEAGKRFVKAESYEWRIRKIQSHGISLWGAFIFGFDHDNWRDLMFTARFAQRMNLAMSCYPVLTPYPGTGVFHEYVRQGRITDWNWDRYNGASVVYDPKHFTPLQLRHAQMAAFAEFYSPRSILRRLKIAPLKKRAWLANLGVWRGIRWYYSRRGRRVPRFRDFLDPGSRAWDYKESNGHPQEVCCGPSPNLAELTVPFAEPYRQAAEFIGSLPSKEHGYRQRIAGVSYARDSN
jgi:radical SAM superfamily enzyme YgiQ (UPF0313 family)